MLSGRRPPHDYLGTVLGTPDPRGLARFYAEVLGWRIHSDEEDWATIAPDQGKVYLGFQLEREHTPPAWPAQPGEQQMQMHLDIEVSDLDAAVAAAQRLGGRVAEHQPQLGVRVIIDPSGHPFCLYVGAAEEAAQTPG
ncbi:VOC family protein [Janibacter terrae]|uniref:VOC family protein n=1 Tax=Janibacter terrae TaxID=103817 RepID=A0ABZ2FC87_9MICO|nr:glyoxalase [Janibacter terrae]